MVNALLIVLIIIIAVFLVINFIKKRKNEKSSFIYCHEP